MKIGVSAIGYECAEHLDKVLAPWVRRKDTVTVASHGVFPETNSLGYPVRSQDGCIEKLEQYEKAGKIKKFVLLEQPNYEKDIRNSTLPFLFDENIDLLLLLDLQDEIYSDIEINNILRFIEYNNDIDWFKINFKNYVFDNKHYIDDFIAPRIWRTDRNGGIDSFYYDNEILYKNRKQANQVSSVIIPRSVAFPKHLSWVGSLPYLDRKIKFQQKHYGQCSYKIDGEKLIFNKDYYIKNNVLMPEVFEEKN